MTRIVLLTLSACSPSLSACTPALSAPPGTQLLAAPCNELRGADGASYVEAVLLEDVGDDVQGWTAIVGADGNYDVAVGVHVEDVALWLRGPCPEGEELRVSIW